jgi:hypothetical protein
MNLKKYVVALIAHFIVFYIIGTTKGIVSEVAIIGAIIIALLTSKK